jgi:mxaJ protein
MQANVSYVWWAQRRGLIQNVRGYMLSGDYQRPNPPAAIVDAVANGKIDVALVWGPLAGYFARRSAVPLRLEPVLPESDGATSPMAYNISVGVRRDNIDLRDRIDSILERRKPEIAALLQAYRVPQAPN